MPLCPAKTHNYNEGTFILVNQCNMNLKSTNNCFDLWNMNPNFKLKNHIKKTKYI